MRVSPLRALDQTNVLPTLTVAVRPDPSVVTAHAVALNHVPLVLMIVALATLVAATTSVEAMSPAQVVR